MKVVVNGKVLDLKPGTSAIDAVYAAGDEIPYFCSHEYMSPVGACRMCLAKIGAPRKDRATGDWVLDEETGEPKIFWFPNPMATCTTTIMDGMVIETEAEEAVKAQRGMVEMTLINHPLDCPVCDKGGACELQDQAYQYGPSESRFVFDKRHQEKNHPLSELISLDRERCIHCKRCIRYFEEIPGDQVLDFIERGGHTYVATAEEGLPSNFTGNITDLCPVGALLDRTSRFKGRNWEYNHTISSSLDDASGSAIVLDSRTGRIERIKAELNTQVNKLWIDDGTRFGYEYANSEDRIQTPLIRKNDNLEPVSWQEAGEFIKAKLSAIAEKETAIVLRADSTIEEGYAAIALAKELKTGQLDHYPRTNASVVSQNPASLNDLASSDAIFVVADVTESVPIVDLRIKDALKGVSPPELLEHGVPIADLRLKERMPRKPEILSVAAPYRVDLMKHAGQQSIYEAGQEEALFDALTKLANKEDVSVPGMSDEEAKALIKRLSDSEKSVVVYDGFVLASAAAANAASRFANAVGAKELILGQMANSYGLEAIQVLPSHERYSYQEILAGSSKALIISGLNPALSSEVAEKLKELKLLVVHDLFQNETTALADVVLPAKSGYEKNGHMINLEGRILEVNAATLNSGMAEDFGYVANLLCQETQDFEQVAKKAVRKRFEIELQSLDPEGELSPVKTKASTKSKVHSKTEVAGNALIVPTMLRLEYLEHNSHLLAERGLGKLRVNSIDAQAKGLKTGQTVELEVAGIKRKLQVSVSDAVPIGLWLLPALPEQTLGLSRVNLDSLKIHELEVA